MRKHLLWIYLSVLVLPAAKAQDAYDRFYRAIRSDDLAGLQQLLDKGASPNVMGSQKMTPLHDAALIGSAEALKLLLEHGAQADAQNSQGATALVYAARDLEKTRLLLDHGAAVDRSGKGGGPLGAGETSALMRASSKKGGVEIVRRLLAKGAHADAADSQGNSPLHAAAAIGDVETMTLLIEKGANVNPAPLVNLNFTPLMVAVLSRQPAAVKLLLSKGANVRAAAPTDTPVRVKNGPIDLGGQTSLHLAAPYGPPEIVKMLLDAGADANAKDIQGMTPLMWAVATEGQNPEIIRMLLARGADPKIKSRDGQTALELAKQLGGSVGIQTLGGTVEKPAAIAVKADGDARSALLHGLEIMDRYAGPKFLDKGGCVACHAQMASLGSAASAQKLTKADLSANRKEAFIGIELGAMQGASGEAFLYTLEAARAMGDIPDRLMDYAVASLLATQHADGSWHGTVPRVPIQDGDYTQTALSVRALAKYAPPAMKAEVSQRLEKSRQWFLNAKPVSTEHNVMRMLGLAATGAGTANVRKAAQAVLQGQRTDGGWGQRPELASDAYATGMALWALADAGQLKPSDAAFPRGVKFLVGTQASDGSWLVKSRAVLRFQPYFESGFPYEHDQWISSMGTGWATKALAVALQ